MHTTHFVKDYTDYRRNYEIKKKSPRRHLVLAFIIVLKSAIYQSKKNEKNEKKTHRDGLIICLSALNWIPTHKLARE